MTCFFKKAVYDYVNEGLINLLSESRKERKDETFSSNSDLIKTLPQFIREEVSEIVDEFQKECPTFGVHELESAVKVLANMEKARSGYELLEKLAYFNSDDIDSLNLILSEWSINDVKKIMKELQWRR